jgi:internalin A
MIYLNSRPSQILREEPAVNPEKLLLFWAFIVGRQPGAGLFVIVLGMAFTPWARGQDKATQPSLEVMRLVVAAWEKAGAEFGWVKTIDLTGTGTEFIPAKQDLDNAAEAYYAAVRFRVFPRGKLHTLPMPERCLRLKLEDDSITDDDLQELTQLVHLQWLVFYRAKVTDAGLKHLAGLQELQRLALPNHNGITSAGMKALAGLKNLQALNFAGTQVADAGLKELAGLKKLQHLNLAGTPVTDAGLKELAGLKSLQTLFLGRTQVTDAGLRDLAQLSTLQRLGLSGARVSDKGLKLLVGLKNLQSLNLRETQVTEAGLKELRESLPKCNISR